MGDRATVQFVYANDPGRVFANVYTHWEGTSFPDVFAGFLRSEDAKIEDAVRDSRYHDPSYLAVRFLAFVSDVWGLGWGLLPPDDREGVNYVVSCGNDRTIPPTVKRS